MVNMESCALLVVPEEEWADDVDSKLIRSLSCFGSCFGQREDGGHDKWWMQSGLSQSIRRVKEYSESVVVEGGGKTWKGIVQYRFRNKKNGRNPKRGQRFQYDLPSYELNFDGGWREKMGSP